MVFNFKEWRKEENYKKVVRPEEDHDLMGNKKCYYMNKDFDIIILSETDDADTKAQIMTLMAPHIKDSFDIYVVA